MAKKNDDPNGFGEAIELGIARATPGTDENLAWEVQQHVKGLKAGDRVKHRKYDLGGGTVMRVHQTHLMVEVHWDRGRSARWVTYHLDELIKF